MCKMSSMCRSIDNDVRGYLFKVSEKVVVSLGGVDAGGGT